MQLKYLSSGQSRKYEYIGDRVTRKYSLLNQNNYSFKKIQIFALSFYKSCKNTCITPSPCALICTSVVHPNFLNIWKMICRGKQEKCTGGATIKCTGGSKKSVQACNDKVYRKEAGILYRRCNDKVYRGKQEYCTGGATTKCTGEAGKVCN